MKEEVISICIASYNTLSTRKEGLDACLDGLDKSIRYFKKLHPDVSVIISWVDDASTDETYPYVDFILRCKDLEFKLLKLKSNSHQGYCRNLATKVVDSDYIMFLDSDDVFLENHIKVCYDIIKGSDSAGRLIALASTNIHLDPELRVHPDWFTRIAGTIPITKIIRREIWEFMEGFPVNDIYKTTGCEDQDFIQLAQHFFTFIMCSAKTVEYKSYPGSFFERQLPKFRKHPNLMTSSDEDSKLRDLHKIRTEFANNRLEYLKAKLVYTDWYQKLEKYSTSYT